MNSSNSILNESLKSRTDAEIEELIDQRFALLVYANDNHMLSAVRFVARRLWNYGTELLRRQQEQPHHEAILS